MADVQIADNVAQIRERIALALERSGRKDTITLLAATKAVDVSRIAEAYDAGVRDFGENYIQGAIAKQDALTNYKDIRWHFIGHLQSNKVKEVTGRFVLIHSVDSLNLANRIGRQSQNSGIFTDILLEIKLDPSNAKFGILPAEAMELIAKVREIPGIRLNGLMGMAPFSLEPEDARPSFRQLRTLFEQIPPESRKVLSMGMTGDFEVAIEEGATLIRIGTAIFGKRPSRE